jgi:hypothetical protein
MLKAIVATKSKRLALPTTQQDGAPQGHQNDAVQERVWYDSCFDDNFEQYHEPYTHHFAVSEGATAAAAQLQYQAPSMQD